MYKNLAQLRSFAQISELYPIVTKLELSQSISLHIGDVICEAVLDNPHRF